MTPSQPNQNGPSPRKRQKTLPRPSQAFTSKKQTILAQLAVPEGEYTDASPKGSVDAGIRELIDEINELEGLVTTSSCAGRVSVFVEGRKKGDEKGNEDEVQAAESTAEDDGQTEGVGGVVAAPVVLGSVGGKGGGGHWLFVSHDPVVIPTPFERQAGSEDDQVRRIMQDLVSVDENEQMNDGHGQRDVRLVHFKFEPMILHILTSSLEHAQLVLNCGVQAGFRETGAVSILSSSPNSPATPAVAIRSTGLGFDSIIARQFGDGPRKETLVTEGGLRILMETANERFAENERRIGRFRQGLKEAMGRFVGSNGTVGSDGSGGLGQQGQGVEGEEERKARKKSEGLRIAAAKREAKARAAADGGLVSHEGEEIVNGSLLVS